jgi:hypothetical protein
MAILIQSIKNATPIYEMILFYKFANNDLLYALFQVYFPLMCLTNIFTHYDLHTGNVLIYEPIKGSYIQYHYHLVNDTVISFKSTYIAKIIDYGRSVFEDAENNTVTGSSLKIYNAICAIKECDPNCGYNVGYNRVNKPNSLNRDLNLFNFIIEIIKKHNPTSTNNVVLKLYDLGAKITENNKTFNVTDLCIALQEIILIPEINANNETAYNGMNTIGDLHMYANGNPISFIPVHL